MIAVFYDRKHRCEVTSEQLGSINFGRATCVGDDDDMHPSDRRHDPQTQEALTEAQYLEFFNKGFYTDKKYSKDSWVTWKPEMICKYPHMTRVSLGDLGYKSDNCPKHSNWDRFLFYSDLVFIRLE